VIIRQIVTAHQDGTVLVREPVDDHAAAELQAAAIEVSLRAQLLQIAAVCIDGDHSGERQQPKFRAGDAIDAASQAVVRDPVAAAKSFRLAGREEHRLRLGVFFQAQGIQCRAESLARSDVGDRHAVGREAEIGDARACAEGDRGVEGLVALGERRRDQQGEASDYQ